MMSVTLKQALSLPHFHNSFTLHFQTISQKRLDNLNVCEYVGRHFTHFHFCTAQRQKGDKIVSQMAIYWSNHFFLQTLRGLFSHYFRLFTCFTKRIGTDPHWVLGIDISILERIYCPECNA